MSGYGVFAAGGNEMERTSFDDGKQSAWPPMAVLAQKLRAVARTH